MSERLGERKHEPCLSLMPFGPNSRRALHSSRSFSFFSYSSLTGCLAGTPARFSSPKAAKNAQATHTTRQIVTCCGLTAERPKQHGDETRLCREPAKGRKDDATEDGGRICYRARY